MLETLAKEPALRYQTGSEIRGDVQTLATRPPMGAAVARGCVGARLHGLRVALDPTLPGQRELYGMPLASGWIPFGLVAFLWFVVAAAQFESVWL